MNDQGTIAVIGGTGALGRGLTIRLADAGAHVVIGSRDPGRAADAAHELGVEGTGNADAAARAGVVFVCVPFVTQLATAKAIKPALREGTIVVDATVPLATAIGGPATQLVGAWRGSAAEQLAAALPEHVRVVSALHTVSAAALADRDAVLDEDVLVAGDDPEAKQTVTDLIGTIPGLRPIDCGRLHSARMIEPLTALLIGVNRRYRTHAGIRLTGVGVPVQR